MFKEMKKTLRIMGLCALAALTFASCKKNEQKADTTTFQATLTQPTGDGRTHIGDGDWLMWDDNDAIKVFTANGSSATFTTHDANATTATFSGNIAEADAYCAFYPAANASGLVNGNVVLTLSNEQQYAEGGFANGTYPMAAYTTGTTFEFHSPCGLLAIPMTGTGTVTSIELTGKLNEPLAGQLLINPVGFDPENPTYTLGDYQTTVTLNCGSGVELEANNAKTFYFVVPKNVFASGFTAVVKNGCTEIYRLETTHNNIIAAERIRLMPTVNVASLGVITSAATEVGYTTATLNGAYTAPAGMNVTEVGFYWGDTTAMTNKVTATTANPFTYALTGLEEGHTYACQAYAKNGENELLGTVVEFTTDEQVVVTVPTVTTAEVTEITPNSALVGGSITDTGNGTISESGICYKTGNDEWTCVALTATNNAFSTTLTGLTLHATYTVRAYATNEAGTGYGSELSFYTDYAYVDLGLPSGLLWATCNVGATTPEGYGNYFAWAETAPKGEYDYNWGTYYYSNGSGEIPEFWKYCNNDTFNVLEPIDDAATDNWGGDWRMPTKAEWQELIDNTTQSFEQIPRGCWLTAKNGSGNKIFLPAAGYYTSDYNSEVGHYWSSTLARSNNTRTAWCLVFNISQQSIAIDGNPSSPYRNDRCYGLPVRAVRPAQ